MIGSTEAAKRLGVDGSRIRQLITDGSLRASKIGNSWIIDESDIEAYIHERAERRLEPRDWLSRDPQRLVTIRRARDAVRAALKSGRLVRGTHCEQCGAENVTIEASHSDYSKPLDVRWLCLSCHRRADAAIPKSVPAVS